MKKKIYQLHKWTGLSLGLVLFLLALSGIALSFREELMPKAYPELFHITPGEKLIPLPELYSRTLQDIGENVTVTNLYASSSPDEAWIFILKDPSKSLPVMKTIDPFTGETVGTMSMAKNVFAIMLFLHTNLFLGKLGSYVVGILGLIAAVFVVSGIYLWLPKTSPLQKLKKTLGQMRTSLQSLHHSLGLLFSVPLLISGITGFLIVFDVSYQLMRPLRNEAVRPEEMERKGSCTRESELKVLHTLSPKVQENLISIHFCTQKSSLMKVSFGLHNNDFLEGYERIIIDPATLEVFQTFNSEKDPSSWNIKRLFIYPIHTGEIFGIVGRSINFVTGFAMVGLVFSGVLLFRKRRIRNLQHKTYMTE